MTEKCHYLSFICNTRNFTPISLSQLLCYSFSPVPARRTRTHHHKIYLKITLTRLLQTHPYTLSYSLQTKIHNVALSDFTQQSPNSNTNKTVKFCYWTLCTLRFLWRSYVSIVLICVTLKENQSRTDTNMPLHQRSLHVVLLWGFQIF